MNKFANEIKKLLEETESFAYGDKLSEDFFYAEYTNNTSFWGDDGDKWPSDVEFELLDRYGGEDMGSDYWSVYRFTRGDESCILKFYGWYQSFHGSEFEGITEVKPKQKTVTVYE